MTQITSLTETLMLRALHLANFLHLRRLLHTGGSSYPFTRYFGGLEKSAAVRRIFGEKTEEVLRDLRVEFTWIGGYMWVDSSNGHIVVNARYLNGGDRVDIYLDLVHELVHVRQLMEGKELFDSRYDYVCRPTEIEAYGFAVEEARSLGLSEARICEYLRTEWMSVEDLRQLARSLSVECSE